MVQAASLYPVYRLSRLMIRYALKTGFWETSTRRAGLIVRDCRQPTLQEVVESTHTKIGSMDGIR